MRRLYTRNSTCSTYLYLFYVNVVQYSVWLNWVIILTESLLRIFRFNLTHSTRYTLHNIVSILLDVTQVSKHNIWYKFTISALFTHSTEKTTKTHASLFNVTIFWLMMNWHAQISSGLCFCLRESFPCSTFIWSVPCSIWESILYLL